jgi:DNA-directed RNA polymerase specialized sigma54-like protein
MSEKIIKKIIEAAKELITFLDEDGFYTMDEDEVTSLKKAIEEYENDEIEPYDGVY